MRYHHQLSRHALSAIAIILAVGFMAVSCTGSSDGKDGKKKRLGSDYEVRFLRDIGINPDTLLVDDVIEYKNLLLERDTHGATWLTMEQIAALRLDELCGADTANSPVRMMAVIPIDKHITLLMLHIFYGDNSPVILATYDSDGMPIDVLNAGTWTGVNTAYGDVARQAIGREEATMTFNGTGHVSVDRTLQLSGQGQPPLWAITNSDTYQVDTRGYILHIEGQMGGDQPEDFVEQRQLEALSWYSIQDEGMISALAQLEGSLSKRADAQLEDLLADRLERSHWTLIPWFKEHPDSPLMNHLKAAARSRGIEEDLNEKLAK